ncbi:hypothetical protein DZB84_10910 [Bacillus sp. HNG]|uniref:DUF6123 family protein n=1 Tax=Bacillaceae TaxID=186817 RepID=UPI000E2E429D|nr:MULTISPECIES: DUF6123 family protein [Bacillaceae]MDR4888636.1 DUF6123 family protein [Fredinandcohnia sp. QZ13]RFB16896.1 hypothetical protein DZB84_10910 [Bacillus sp. HNG]
MFKLENRVKEYLQFLAQKGFNLGEDAVGFISFGQHYTGATDEIVNVAIEITLKAQKEFDGSFFISLLEMLKENQIQNRKQAYQFVEERNIMS